MIKPSIGQSLDRVEGYLKVTGTARYTAEMPIENVLHAVIVQSTITRGRILHINAEVSASLPGVVDVITHLNAPRIYASPLGLPADKKNIMAGTTGQRHMPLQDDVIYYNGQHIAVVVAHTLQQATYAAAQLQVEYEQETPMTNVQDEHSHAFAPQMVWGDPADTVKGNIKQGLTEAVHKVDQTYVTAMQHHNPIETHATIAVWQDDEITLYEPSTWIDGIRRAVSFWFNMPINKIRVLQRYIGGSFGCKGPTWPHVALALIAAKRAGQPVKLVLTRQQSFTSVGYRPEIHHHIFLGATNSGHLTVLVHNTVAQTAQFDNRVVAPVTKTSRKIYRCPNIATTYRLVRLNRAGPFTMRGPGDTPGSFALESALDELSYTLAIDPIELRLRNDAEVDQETGLPWTSKSLKQCYLQGAERFGWQKRNPRPGSMCQDGHLVGWGVATSALDSLMLPTAASARFFDDGTCLVESGTSDQGTGTYTIMGQIAADALGIAFDQVRFELGDTHMPTAPISAGSMTAASVGSAVNAATTKLRHKLLSLAISDPASPLYQQQEVQIVTRDGRCFLKEDNTRAETYQEILRRHALNVVDATEKSVPSSERLKHTSYSFGAHFVEVSIDPDLGIIQVSRYVGAFSAGRIVNPKTAHSQLIGGIVWGISMALLEQTIPDPHTGRITNMSLEDYHVAVHADIPQLEAFFIQEEDELTNSLGIKGLGEIGTIGCAAAIANAIYHATGKRIRELPITLEKLL